jgi:hypothetical protein
MKHSVISAEESDHLLLWRALVSTLISKNKKGERLIEIDRSYKITDEAMNYLSQGIKYLSSLQNLNLNFAG